MYKLTDRFRLWLAAVLYRWSCWLAGRDVAEPGAFEVLQAQRMERIAREWHGKYQQLRQGKVLRRTIQRVEF